MQMQKRKVVTRFIGPTALAIVVFVIGARGVIATGADIYGVGGGSINFGGAVKFVKFAFSGHTGPQGDFGSFRFTFEDPTAPLDVHVDIDCVNVSAISPGTAGGWMGGAVKTVTPQPNAYFVNPGDQLVFAINDFGEPSDPVPDEINAYYGFLQACKTVVPGPQTPIDQGNIVIKVE
jgi:hypothetical protein